MRSLGLVFEVDASDAPEVVDAALAPGEVVSGLAVGKVDRKLLRHVLLRELIVGLATGVVVGLITVIGGSGAGRFARENTDHRRAEPSDSGANLPPGLILRYER